MPAAPTSLSLQPSLWQTVEGLGAAGMVLLCIIACAGLWQRFRSWTVRESNTLENQGAHGVPGVYNSKPTKRMLCKTKPPPIIPRESKSKSKDVPRMSDPLYENVGAPWVPSQSNLHSFTRSFGMQHVPEADETSIYLNDSSNIYYNCDYPQTRGGYYEEDYIFPDERSISHGNS